MVNDLFWESSFEDMKKDTGKAKITTTAYCAVKVLKKALFIRWKVFFMKQNAI